MTKLRIATRASTLALTQSRWVADVIRAHHADIEIEEVHVSTQGDRERDRPLADIGGKGLFVAEIEAALVRGEADIAVHSLKDVPGDTPLAAGMILGAFPVRAPAHDVLITTGGLDLQSLPLGARIGTTSLRRSIQLQTARQDLEFRMLRGNIETRVQRLRDGAFDAIVLAAAGLERTGVLATTSHWALPTDICLPAVGQGTLGIEVAEARGDVRALLACLDHHATRVATTAERTLLKALLGNCHSPIAGYACLIEESQTLRLEGLVAAHDGDVVLQASSDVRLPRGVDDQLRIARELGQNVAEQLLDSGARKLIEGAAVAAATRRVTSN